MKKMSKSSIPIEEQKAMEARAKEIEANRAPYAMLVPGKGATVVFDDGTKIHGTIDMESAGMLLLSDDGDPIYFDNINHCYWS